MKASFAVSCAARVPVTISSVLLIVARAETDEEQEDSACPRASHLLFFRCGHFAAIFRGRYSGNTHFGVAARGDSPPLQPAATFLLPLPFVPTVVVPVVAASTAILAVPLVAAIGPGVQDKTMLARSPSSSLTQLVAPLSPPVDHSRAVDSAMSHQSPTFGVVLERRKR